MRAANASTSTDASTADTLIAWGFSSLPLLHGSGNESMLMKWPCPELML
jgi:hypothetical protein